MNSFADWLDLYETFDLRSLVVEAATLREEEPVNRSMAMFSRLLDLTTNHLEMSDQDRVNAMRLAVSMNREIDRATAKRSGSQEAWHRARDAQIARLIEHGSYPEYMRVLGPVLKGDEA